MRYNVNTAAVEMSADELCDMCFRTGKCGAGRRPIHESARQKCRDELAKGNAFFSADKEFCCTSSFGGIYYEVKGRADGIVRQNGKVTLFMILPVREYAFRKPPDAVFSAKCISLAHFACEEYALDEITAEIEIYNVDSEKKRSIKKDFSASVLRRTYLGYLAKIERFAKLCVSREMNLRPSVAAMKFPFEKVRKGQRELVEEVYRTIHDGTRLFAQAPTGIGKTMSVLYPAVKASAAGLCGKVFYLTAKASTGREAFSAVRKMFEAGAQIRAVMLSSKEQMCICDAAKLSGRKISDFCRGENCEFADGYYSRVSDALYELLSGANGYTSALISETAKKHRVCPYELSLDVSEYCDVIICDYNYVFDPQVCLRRYFERDSEENAEKYVFLIDEAHNLADRAREMYSSSLSLGLFEAVSEQIMQAGGKLSSALEEIFRAFRALKRLCADNLTKDDKGEHGFYFAAEPPAFLERALSNFIALSDEWCKKHPDAPLCDELGVLRDRIRDYISALERYDEHFRTYVLVDGDDTLIKLYCIDPSHLLDLCMRRACASVLFSATLTPTDYFADILGGGKNSVTLSLPSPFPRENLCLVAMTGISTRHADRDASAQKTAVCIAASVLPKKGNYIVYFPSYSYMERVAAAFTKKFPAVTTEIQTRKMSHAEREKFIGFFKPDSDVLRIGFCVLGGSFSEGVDLPGNRLIGSIIVGVGLPQLSNDLNIIRDFYEDKYERGYDYAYTFPGMNKVLQACGRVIRREDDRGIVVLIDDRYASPQYRALFPPHWENIKFASSSSELAKTIEDFWKNTYKL